MAKKIKKVEVEEGIEKDVVVEPKVEAPKEEKKVSKLPATATATEKFYALEVEGGAVIINPNGFRVSKLMTLDRAAKDAQRMNR